MDFRRVRLALVVSAAAVALGALPAWSALPTAPRKAAPGPYGAQGPARSTVIDSQRRIDVNQINMWVTNYGSFAWDLTTGDAGLDFPRGTDKTAVFASGIWLGAKVGSEVRTEVAEYSQEYGPGAMIGGTFDDPANASYRAWKVVRYTAPADSDHVNRTSDETSADPTADPLLHHSWEEYLNNAAPYGAPTRNYRLPDPNTPGDSVDVLGPDVQGDEMIWAVYNDANPANHTNDAGGSTPLGLEIQQTTFGFNRQGPLGNTVFIKFLIINKGSNTLDSMYVSLWSDPDLGGAADDLVGVDTTVSLGYCYNSTNNDQLYGATPPAVGYDFFLGPTNALGDTLPMTSFNKYINGTDPASFTETYNYMKGLQPNGDPVVNPITGLETTFFNSGDPVLGTGWLDSNPADRRFMMSAGPFQMSPGDTQVVVGAIIMGQGKDRLSSISALKFNDTFAQLAFDENFNLPSPPSQPIVDVAVDHQTVHLAWDAASRNNYNEPGYTFEGYNVYQGASVAGPWKLIATYDEVNSVRVIYDEVFDVETGQLIPEFPVEFGSDAGVQYDHTITQDAIRGGPLHDGTEYYFAVTAYSYGPTETPKTLENAQKVIRVTPQRPALGTDLATASATVTYSRINPLKPPATDVITATVVDPNLVTGDDYRIVFKPTGSPAPTINGYDVLYSWSLVDVTTGDTLLNNQLNRGTGPYSDTGADDFRVIDGILWRVAGQYAPAFQEANYLNDNPTNRRALTGVNWGGASFFGGADSGWNFFGGTIDPSADPDSFTTVELRFSSTNTQKAYRFLRLELADGSAPAVGREYRYGGFRDCNFTCWDAVNNIQLDVAFVERAVTDDAGTLQPPAEQPATFDSTWAPDESGTGGREYLMVIRRPYSDVEKPSIAQDGSIANDTLPLMWALWAAKRSATDVIDDGDRFEWLWANPATDNDVYDVSTSKLVRANAALAKTGLGKIRVVPNPYYNRSNYELNQFNRVIRFINMPETATIRIFNLAGQLVRTIHKTDPTTSVAQWDLLTDNQLPVGSGVYIYHIDAGAAGSTFGRMVVFMEKERLNNF